MENVKVGILDPMAVEVGRGIGFGIEWGGVLSFFSAPHTNQMSLFVNSPEANVLCNFRLVLLVKEDKGVVAHVASIEESPPYSRVSRVFQLSSKRGFKLNGGQAGRCSKRDGGVVVSGEMDGFVTLDTVITYKGFNFV